jgi:hypothetical protein
VTLRSNHGRKEGVTHVPRNPSYGDRCQRSRCEPQILQRWTRPRVLNDRQVQGNWPGLFGAPSQSLRAVILEDSHVPDDSAGVLELNVFDGEVQPGVQSTAPTTGFFLLSFFVDVDATLHRLSELDLGGLPKRVNQPGPAGAIGIATVHDPDGLTILLTPGSITRTT